MEIKKNPAKNKTKIETKKTLIVVHWAATYGKGCEAWFTSDANKRSSAHYVINRHGEVTQMVDEKYIAWHAGYSTLADYPGDTRKIYQSKVGKTEWFSLNPCSIGIELAGPPTSINTIIQKYNWTWDLWTGWPEKEIQGLVALCIDIKTRWPGIKLTDHSTISTRFDKKKNQFYVDRDGKYVHGWRKGDVKRGKGINLFPWDRLLEETGIKEA